MILADTSIWIDHFRSRNQVLFDLLRKRKIVMHPYVIAELALGSLRERPLTLEYLDRLPSLQVARPSEVRRMIEVRSLYGKGIGLVDAHLLASALIQVPTLLWTADKRLRTAAAGIGVDANIS